MAAGTRFFWRGRTRAQHTSSRLPIAPISMDSPAFNQYPLC